MSIVVGKLCKRTHDFHPHGYLVLVELNTKSHKIYTRTCWTWHSENLWLNEFTFLLWRRHSYKIRNLRELKCNQIFYVQFWFIYKSKVYVTNKIATRFSKVWCIYKCMYKFMVKLVIYLSVHKCGFSKIQVQIDVLFSYGLSILTYQSTLFCIHCNCILMIHAFLGETCRLSG